MAHYFAKITADHWIPKNSLEEAIQKFAREMDRRLLRNFEIPQFKIRFREKIKELNKAHPRCKPAEIEIRSSFINKDETWISVAQVFEMTIYKAKETL